MADDLEQRFHALRAAVAAKDPGAVTQVLEGIDEAIKDADPLTRAATYAQIQLERGKPLEAAEVLDDVMAAIGDDARVYLQIGRYRRQGGDAQGALEAFERATRTDRMCTDAWLARGTIYDERGDPGAALECYRNALLSDPTHVPTWRNLGNALAAQRKYDEAAGAYDTALGLAVGDPTIAFLRASAHQAKGDLETANRLLSTAQRGELGEAYEVRRGESVCRFRAIEANTTACRAAAAQLLEDLDIQGETLPARRGDVFIVSYEDSIYVCDPDPVHSAHPHRFLDASALVRKRSAR